MICSILLPVCWGLLLSFLKSFWYKTESFLPDWIYFSIEEFFAFNIHNNTLFMKLPMALLFVVFFIWALIENGKNIRFSDFLMIIFVLIFLTNFHINPASTPPNIEDKVSAGIHAPSGFIIIPRTSISPDVIPPYNGPNKTAGRRDINIEGLILIPVPPPIITI